MPRRTLARSAAVSGVGLHTGSRVSALCQAAPAGQGIVFRRTDLPGTPVIPARLSEVQSTERRTALGQGETVVQTVEHLLAAAAALQIDDLTIDLDGPEPPIGDGSFSPYLSALQEAGIAGYDYRGQTGFNSTFGGKEVVAILERAPEAKIVKYEYRLLATKKTSTMQKELSEAGERGFEFVGMTVAQTLVGGDEVVAILRRKLR